MQDRVQGVSRVVDYIRRLIEQNKTLANINVRGEVSGLTERNGRLYFSLKENADLLNCFVWSNAATRLPPFKNGDEIICEGDFSTYSPRSVYQIVVRNIELTGAGALFAQFEALKERFRAEGVFDRERKRPLPAFPKRIAVVSAPGGRGVEDFFATIAREAPFVEVRFVETRVQGDGAEIEIAQAIDAASRMDVDVIVVTRGGGSYEDLFAFNREPVVRAILRALHPVLTAIGHEPDQHLADLAADESCETPSNAAHYFAAIGTRFRNRIQRGNDGLVRAAGLIVAARAQRADLLVRDLRNAASVQIPERRQRLHALEGRLNAQTPQQRLTQRAARLTGLYTRLDANARYYGKPRIERLEQLGRSMLRLRDTAVREHGERFRDVHTRLNALDPKALLARGYAIVTLAGRTVRDAGDVPIGASIGVQLQHGRFVAKVERKEHDG